MINLIIYIWYYKSLFLDLVKFKITIWLLKKGWLGAQDEIGGDGWENPLTIFYFILLYWNEIRIGNTRSGKRKRDIQDVEDDSAIGFTSITIGKIKSGTLTHVTILNA
jgi:hypothetical protein